MATPTFKGTTGFRVQSEVESIVEEGVDSLIVNVRGQYDQLNTFKTNWPRGKVASGLTSIGGSTDYPNMYLKNLRPQNHGPFSSVDMEFHGSISTSVNNPVSTSQNISRMGTVLTTDEDESVSFEFYGESFTRTWMQYGTTRPKLPKYGLSPGTDVPVGILFNPSPANFEGSVEAQWGTFLAQFNVVDLAPTVFMAVETWEFRVIPITPITAAE